MSRIILPLLISLLMLPAFGHAQQDAGAILDAVKAQYDKVNDYKVRINAVIKMKGLSVPPMDATMYFKKPDKIQVESDGFAMLPRDAVGFHPAMFNKDEYDLVVQGTERVQNIECTKVKLLARSDTLRLQRAMIYVDTKRAIILRMDFDPGTGASATADFSYGLVDNKYFLPSRIDIEMDSPMRWQRPGQKVKPDDNAGDGKARISMKYIGYVVNKGIPDSVFENKAPTSPRRDKK
ncbi:MAG: hypothetical protein IH600_16885 [Bacteroidetes bacterium]|nr:hypothetical protein [Bacteroidota bacterium]